MTVSNNKKLPNYILQRIPKLRNLIKDTIPEFKHESLKLHPYIKKSNFVSDHTGAVSYWEFIYSSKNTHEVRIKFARDSYHYLNDFEYWMLCKIRPYDGADSFDSLEENDDSFRLYSENADFYWKNLRYSQEFNTFYTNNLARYFI